MKKFIFVMFNLLFVFSILANEKDSLDFENKKGFFMCSDKSFQARQISDPILHSIPKKVNFAQKDKINKCIKIMQETQNNLGGVGIACNQCYIDDPLQIIIIGSDDPNLIELAKKRYPNETLLGSTIMINPKILEYSDETYYPDSGEGCLSVNGSIRAKVLRHRSLTYSNV